MWQPQPELARQLLDLLTAISEAKDNETHKRLYQELERAKEHPEFANYLCLVLCSKDQVRDDLRRFAGILLKNLVPKEIKKIGPSQLEYIKANMLVVLEDSSEVIRRTSGGVVVSIVQHFGIHSWIEFENILKMDIKSFNPILLDGVLNAVWKIAEDCPNELVHTLETLIPQLISLMTSDTESIRMSSLKALTFIIPGMNKVVISNLPHIFEGLVKLGNDSLEESRILVAQNFLLLTELCSDYMEPVFPAIISLMFYYLMNDVPEVAIISTEFFGTYSLKAGTDKSLLMPILPQILSTCLSQMSLSESDISEFEEAELEYNQPDRLEDIKPIHYNRKKDDISSSGADFDGSDSEDVDEDEYGEWNIRKCSARTIDNLACAYKDDLLPLILPIIGKSLESQNWIQCESGILALGAISNGCAQGLRIHLPNLVEYLIRLCNSAKLAVSVISCWTLSRFSSWIMSEENRDKFAPLALEATLNAMQQKNRKLQEASCTSFANFCECSEGYFGKFGSVITTCLLQCLQKYQIRNSTILYAAIATFVRNIDQNSLKETGYFFHLTGSMLSRWKSLSKTDMTIINLMESVLGIIEASGELYAQFFEETLHLSLKQCDHILVEIQNYEIEIHSGNEKIEEPNRDFFICSLDMLGGLAESLGLGAANSFCSHLPEILQFLHSAITDGWASVRQSGLGLLGELLRVIPSALEPHLNQLLPHVISNLSEHFPAVCNNAGWVIGELAAAIGPKVSIYISDILPRISLLYLDASGDSIENLLLNMSITMGRLAHVCPEKVSTCTPELLRLWLQYLGRYTDDNEKFLAVMGALRVFQVNMQKLVLLLPDLVCLLVMMKDMTQQIREFATHIIIEYQRGLGPQQWAVATQRLSQRSKDLFKQNFGIAI